MNMAFFANVKYDMEGFRPKPALQWSFGLRLQSLHCMSIGWKIPAPLVDKRVEVNASESRYKHCWSEWLPFISWALHLTGD